MKTGDYRLQGDGIGCVHRRRFWVPVVLFVMLTGIYSGAHAQPNYDTYFLPDMFSIDRIPVTCTTDIFVLDPKLPVAGLNQGDGHIVLNPDILDTMPTVLQLYVADRACAETMVGKDQQAGDCWTVRNGRDQGWFNPKAFALLMRLLQQKPEQGWPAAPTQARLDAMESCYARP